MSVTAYVDVAGPAGPIHTFVAAPEGGTPGPAVLFYSDIFQLTPPHVRLAQRLAGHGYRVFAPEIYGRFEPGGRVLDFDRDRQRALDDSGKLRVEDVDADRRALLDHIASRSDVDPARIFAAGFCFGGHLAFRAAYEPRVKAVTCFYPTTVHADRLGASAEVDTLTAAASLHAPLLLVWGSRDPHIPAEGRTKIHEALDRAGARYETRIFDAEHAFMRDEGLRYDQASSDAAFDAMLAFFAR